MIQILGKFSQLHGIKSILSGKSLNMGNMTQVSDLTLGPLVHFYNISDLQTKCQCQNVHLQDIFKYVHLYCLLYDKHFESQL
jgi:hypothetical protein